MKKLLAGLILGACVVLTAQADVKAGQKAYLKTFKQAFGGMSGVKFAADHSVAEWTKLFDNDAKGFIAEYTEKFPKAAPILQNPSNAKKIKDIGDFAKEYGNDSGNVPSCG